MQPCCLEDCPPGDSRGPRGIASVHAEVLLARQVSRPNLCPIYEIFRCDEAPSAFLFLTMKLLAGDTLDAYIRKGLLISRDEALEIFRQMRSRPLPFTAMRVPPPSAR